MQMVNTYWSKTLKYFNFHLKYQYVIDVNLKFCSLYDVEGYTVERALKEACIPVMGIETDYTDNDAEQLRTRIGAFIEMIGTK